MVRATGWWVAWQRAAGRLGAGGAGSADRTFRGAASRREGVGGCTRCEGSVSRQARLRASAGRDRGSCPLEYCPSGRPGRPFGEGWGSWSAGPPALRSLAGLPGRWSGQPSGRPGSRASGSGRGGHTGATVACRPCGGTSGAFVGWNRPTRVPEGANPWERRNAERGTNRVVGSPGQWTSGTSCAEGDKTLGESALPLVGGATASGHTLKRRPKLRRGRSVWSNSGPAARQEYPERPLGREGVGRSPTRALLPGIPNL